MYVQYFIIFFLITAVKQLLTKKPCTAVMRRAEICKFQEDGSYVRTRNNEIINKNSFLVAACNNNWDLIKLFTDNRYDMNYAKEAGTTAILWAAETGKWDIVHKILEGTAYINLQDNFKRSILHVASANNQWELVKILVNNGSNINAIDNFGRTSVIIAASMRKWDVVQWLILRGANIDSRDGFGRSILLLAASSKNWELVKWLLIKGADPSVTDRQGRTVLHLAASVSNMEMVQLLVEDFGMNYEQQDKTGSTPVNLAATHNDPTGLVYKYLVSMREKKSSNVTYRSKDADYTLKNISLLNRVGRTYDLINKGDAFMNLKRYRNAILVLGNHGSGKSTLIQYLTMDPSQLISQEIVEGSKSFKIVSKNGSSVPSSIFPRFVIHEETKVVFSDGPGFSDTGSLSHDITAMHFIRKIARKFKNVKLVFTISHLTCKRSLHTEEYFTFLQHAVNLIRDYPHFAKSSCIVVTKMEDMRKENVDSELESCAARYIGNLWQSLKAKLDENVPNEQIEFYNKAIEFLNIFIQKNENGKFDRIRIFRRPKEPGPIGELKLLEWSRKQLVKFIFDDLPYAAVKRKHFHYPLSAGILSTIYNVQHEINKEIASSVASIAHYVQNQLHTRASNSDNIYELRDLFHTSCESIQQVLIVISKETNSAAIIGNIRLALENIKLFPPRYATHSVQYLGTFLVFLQKILNRKLINTPAEWLHPFRILLMDLRETRNWYYFVTSFSEQLLTYSFQKDHIKFLLDRNRSQKDLHIDENNVETFITRLKQTNADIKHLNSVQLRHFYEFEIESLNKVLQFTLLNDITVKDNIVIGAYITVGHVVEQLKKRKVESITVYACDKIYVDTTFPKWIEQLLIVAPNWDIIDRNTFQLQTNGSFRGIGMNLSNYENLVIQFKDIEDEIRIKPDPVHEVTIFEGGRVGQEINKELNYYRSFCTKYLNNPIASPKIKEFFKAIDNSSNILKHYKTKLLLEDLVLLEETYFKQRDKVDFLFLYESLLKRIDRYSKNPRENENNDGFKLALSHFYSAAMSKIIALRHSRYDNVVLNIVEFFQLSTYTIEQVKEKGNRVAATQHRKKLFADMEKQTTECIEIIEKQVMPIVADTFVGLNRSLEMLTHQINELLFELEVYKKALEDFKMNLIGQLLMSSVFTITSIAGSFCSLGTKVAGQLGSALSSSADFYNKMLPSPKLTAKPPHVPEIPTLDTIHYPRNPKYLANESFFIIRERYKKTLDEVYEWAVKKYFDEFEENYIDRLQSIDVDALQEAFSNLHDAITETFDDILLLGEDRTKFHWENEKFGAVKDLACTVGFKAIDFGLTGTKFLQRYTQISEAVEEVDEKLQLLTSFRDKVDREMHGIIKQMQDDVNSINEQFQNLTAPELAFVHYQIDSRLEDVKVQISMSLEEWCTVRLNIEGQIESLQSAMDLEVKLFKQLSEYKDHVNLAISMNDMANPNFLESNYPEELKGDIEKLDLMISSNLLLYHYEKAVGALKQWVFPFAHDYLGMYNIPKELNYNTDITNMITRTKEELLTIQLSILTDAAMATNRDRCTLNYKFYSRNPKGPFYIWKNSENLDFISKLFSGEEVTKNVDIEQKLNLNAIKFRYIKLSFRASSAEMQQSLDEILKYFEVKLTHMGNSHFHCDGKIYLMKTQSIEIQYSIFEEPEGKPITANNIFNKLRRGEMMLSPYALWKFALLDTSGRGNYDKLMGFVQNVDLILEGEGQYLNEDCVTACNQNVEMYYKVDKVA